MRHYPIPFNEGGRLEAVSAIRMARSAATPALDEVVELVCRILDVPTALVSLVDRDNQWFKARSGFDLTETERDLAVCAHTILTGEPLIVPDTHADPRFANHPVVVKPPYLRFYCGAPIVLASGFRVGSLCAFDFKPRAEPSAESVAMLGRLARIVAGTFDMLTMGPVQTAPAEASEAGATDRARREFLSLIGHELLTPLNGVLGLTQGLEDTADDEMAVEVICGIRSSGEHLRQLIERILKFSDLGTGELQLKEEWIASSTLVDGTMTLVGPQADTAGDDLICGTFDIPERLYVDGAQLELVFSAVIGNAIVHGGGNITFAARTDMEGAIVFSVRDDGAGIDPAHAETILEPFTIGEEVLRRRGAGIGLGLPLSRRLVELHGGELALGRADGWAEVTVTLPAWRGDTS